MTSTFDVHLSLMSDLSSALSAIPPVTRTLLIATAAITGPCLLQMLSPFHVALSWFRVFDHYEIWRPFTAFFFGGSGFPLLYDFFLIYRNSSHLEIVVYRGDTAQYAWTHIVLALAILLINTVVGHPFLFRPLLHAQTYLWCRANPTMKVSIFGLITIPTSLYPPALILLDLLTGGPGKAIGGIMGVVAGHFWWFCSSFLPLHAPAHLRRSNPLQAPVRFRALFNPPVRPSFSASGATSTGTSSSRRPLGREDPTEAVRHRWGGGQRLGGE
ncbi:Der1-like family-domain-containing protein [Papiliotrema laurentii]|uniref:Derlin n=1 Tax=Papiliotrema laurentii TaxID=5418 RepID=A0AAD9CWN8_PAPLA|nr:Der1-like family-domain-containing protein [Papiliotrema laurentii]